MQGDSPINSANSLDWIEQSIKQIADEIENDPSTSERSTEEDIESSLSKDCASDNLSEVIEQSEKTVQAPKRELPCTPRAQKVQATNYESCNIRTRSGLYKQYQMSIQDDMVVFERPESSQKPRLSYSIDHIQCLKGSQVDSMYSLKLVQSQAQQRFIYFESEEAQNYWHMKILREQGYLDQRIKQYKPVQKLGEGSFGTVMLAEHKNSGVKVAVKFINKAHIA